MVLVWPGPGAVLTDSPLELQAADGVGLAAVAPGAVSELRDEALGGGVHRARVQQLVHQLHTRDVLTVAPHQLRPAQTRTVRMRQLILQSPNQSAAFSPPIVLAMNPPTP